MATSFKVYVVKGATLNAKTKLFDTEDIDKVSVEEVDAIFSNPLERDFAGIETSAGEKINGYLFKSKKDVRSFLISAITPAKRRVEEELQKYKDLKTRVIDVLRDE